MFKTAQYVTNMLLLYLI